MNTPNVSSVHIQHLISQQDIHCKSDCKSKLRLAQDEIFRLQTEMTERKLEIKGKCDEVTRLRNRCVTLETSLDEVSRNLETSNRCRASSEQALQILQSEKESFVKSRDWYRDQMRLAQVNVIIISYLGRVIKLQNWLKLSSK
jgi:hypothetical protein